MSDYMAGPTGKEYPRAHRRWCGALVTGCDCGVEARLIAAARGEGRKPHPGQPHEFRVECTSCGEPGMVNLTLITAGEKVEVREADPYNLTSDDGGHNDR